MEFSGGSDEELGVGCADVLACCGVDWFAEEEGVVGVFAVVHEGVDLRDHVSLWVDGNVVVVGGGEERSGELE